MKSYEMPQQQPRKGKQLRPSIPSKWSGSRGLVFLFDERRADIATQPLLARGGGRPKERAGKRRPQVHHLRGLLGRKAEDLEKDEERVQDAT